MYVFRDYSCLSILGIELVSYFHFNSGFLFIYSDVVLVCITICNTSQRLCTRFVMMSSNGNIFRVTGHLCGEFTGPGEFPAQRPVTRSFDVFFDLRLNKRSSKQPWGWWFETPPWSLWRHCNGALCVSILHIFLTYGWVARGVSFPVKRPWRI